MSTKINRFVFSPTPLLAITIAVALLMPAANRAMPYGDSAPVAPRALCWLRPALQRSTTATQGIESKLQTVPLRNEKLLEEVERRAFRFFWEQADPQTGLTNDRANNGIGAKPKDSNYTVASTASTGYALASLPIAVEHQWISRTQAQERALRTLRYLFHKLPNKQGWYYHFLDKSTGQRVWNSELSTIDTSLLLEGVLIAGQYWKGTDVSRLANAIYNRVDWTWARTNGGAQPDKTLVTMGWRPESGFLKNNWDHYCELMLLYLLGMGSPTHPLPAQSWRDWQRNPVTYGERITLAGGPIFLHEMAHAFYNFRGQRDSLGYNYWVSSEQAVQINRQVCLALARDGKRRGYEENIWGLNASDGPDGYKAYGAPPSEEDGTVSPTGALSAILFTPALAKRAANAMVASYGDKIWGRYGFSDAFNLDRNWYDPDVIGIDLGMALLAIEDARTGLPWKLLASHPATQRAWKAAGFHPSTDNTRLHSIANTGN